MKYIYLAAVKLSTGCVKLIDVVKHACIPVYIYSCLKHGDHYVICQIYDGFISLGVFNFSSLANNPAILHNVEMYQAKLT